MVRVWQIIVNIGVQHWKIVCVWWIIIDNVLQLHDTLVQHLLHMLPD
jgi:hypothetical protein